MVEIITDSFRDVIRVVPVLFLVILLADFLTAKLKKGSPFFSALAKLDIAGGAILGIIPQCGISVAFAKLYANGYVTLGMLMAVFLAGSDEALIVLAAHPDKWPLMFKVILIKVIVALGAGYLINLLIKEKRNRLTGCGIDCDCPKCRHHHNLLLNSLIHTLKISVFLYLTVFVIELGLDKFGEESLYSFLGTNSFMQPVYASLLGMIPSCLSSVVIAEGYVKGAIGFGSLIAGLCANTGYGILILFRDVPLKKTLWILLLLQLISILVGEFFYLTTSSTGGIISGL